MPEGPKGGKRPGDVISATIMGAKIATDEIDRSDAPEDDGKDPAAKALGAKGGRARGEDDAGAAGGDCAEGGD
jgi:hypothetical protein